MVLLPRGSSRRQCCSRKLETSLAVPEGSEPPGSAAEKISRQNDRRMLAEGFSTTMPASKRPPKKWTTSHTFHQVSSHKFLQFGRAVCDEDPARRLLKQTHHTPHTTHDKLQSCDIRYKLATVRPLEYSRHSQRSQHHKSLAGCESVP